MVSITCSDQRTLVRTGALPPDERTVPAPARTAGDHARAAIRRTYWCDATAHTPDGRMIWLGGRNCGSPPAALLWVAWRAGHFADQIDVSLARPLRAWQADEPEHERAVQRLEQGSTYALVVRDDEAQYVLAVTPGTFDDGGEELCDEF
ncbi:hypothetical protein ABZ921_33550 [Streptomyces atriruber]|uniref:Uncharacterized protein n=1 Tax=Streptomyces atriruber TaxID=545121 RepID=A0ABV3BXS9_9ACTN